MEAATESMKGISTLGWVGIGATIAAVATMWGSIKSWLVTLSSIVIWRDVVSAEGGEALKWWLTKQEKRGFMLTSYSYHYGYVVRNYKNNTWITAITEMLYAGGRMKVLKSNAKFFKKFPVWIGNTGNKDIVQTMPGGPSSFMSIISIRGTFDFDSFITQVCEEYDQFKREGEKSRPKFKFVRVSGTRGVSMKAALASTVKNGEDGKSSGGVPEMDGPYYSNSLLVNRPINFKAEDLAPGLGFANDVVFSNAHEDFMADMRWWVQNEKWYSNRGINWRRGYLLFGKPGTGKTRLVRMAARDLNLPVFSFDLSTFTNVEFTKKWEETCAQAPAIILIEDFDAVFCGRQNLTDTTEDKGLTFDCFLSCLDGINSNNGVSVVMTTNNLSCLDEAIAKEGRPTRPGRIDFCIEMNPLTITGAQLVAEKIVVEPALVAEIIEAFKKSEERKEPWTIAQCIERCTEQAMRIAMNKPKAKQ